MYRSITVKFFLLCCFALITVACSKAPQFHYADGTAGHLEDFAGKTTLVNYWAEWCKPCLKEIPDLSELHHSYDDIDVIAVNWDGISGDQLTQSASKLGIDFPMIIEDISPLIGQKKPAVLPTTYIFNSQGILEQTLVGPQTLESLKKALGK